MPARLSSGEDPHFMAESLLLIAPSHGRKETRTLSEASALRALTPSMTVLTS